MSRLIDAFEQFFDANGQPLSNGYLRFYENGTTTFQDTYEDEAQTIPNANPMQLTGDGKVNGNVYASLVYTVQLLDVNLNVIEAYDNVEPRGGVSTGSTIPNWDSTTNYVANNSIVLAGDGNYYIAIQANMNQNPVSDTNFEYWKRVKFDEWYSQFITYSLNDIVIASDGQQYISLTGSNINNNPVGNGGVEWELYATNEWSTGKSYLAGDVRIADNGRWYKAVIDNSGNEPSADDGTNWLPSQGLVDNPSNVLPANLSTGVSRTPTLTTSAFSVSGGSDDHEYSQYQLSDDGFTTIAYDSLLQPTDLESHTLSVMLDGATEYSYRARHKGVFSGRSDWSTVTTFTTTFPLSEFYSQDLYVGTGAVRSIVNGIDLSTNTGSVFIANIDAGTENLKVVDTQRGVGLSLQPGVSAIEQSEPNGLTSFNSDGFSVGTDAAYNANTQDIFSFSIRRQQGLFDAVRYTGTGSNRTLAHSINADIGLMFCLQESGTLPGSTPYIKSWFSLMSGASANAIFTVGGVPSSQPTVWNSTAPTDSVFSLGTSDNVNRAGANYTMYLFANNPQAGIVSGSYSGTSASGNKITTGFNTGLVIILNASTAVRPTVLISKNIGTSNKIEITDGVTTVTAGGPDSFDSDGFTLSSDNETNQAGNTYFYLAIADENVF